MRNTTVVGKHCGVIRSEAWENEFRRGSSQRLMRQRNHWVVYGMRMQGRTRDLGKSADCKQ